MRNKCETNADRNERETSKKTKQTWKLVWFRLRLLISRATNHLNHTKLHLNYTWITLDYTWIRPESDLNQTWITPNHHTELHQNRTWKYNRITHNYTWITTVEHNTELHLNYTWTKLESHWITPESHLNYTWITLRFASESAQRGDTLRGVTRNNDS
jgi:hypothetical protein